MCIWAPLVNLRRSEAKACGKTEAHQIKGGIGLIYTTWGGGKTPAAALLYQPDLAIRPRGNVASQHERAMGMQDPQRELTLYKGLERFIFRYERGQEERLLDILIEYAGQSHTNLDWFDVSVLSLKLA